jgi:hypothetical protein
MKMVPGMNGATAVMALGSDYDATRAVGLRARMVRIDGVDFVDFNYTNNKITVKFDPDLVSLRELEGVVVRERKHHARFVKRPRNRSGVFGGFT